MSTKPPIKFTCPQCSATHERGYLNGVDVFRCLKCGYVGFGYHPDPEIDREVHLDAKEAEEWNRANGIEAVQP